MKPVHSCKQETGLAVHAEPTQRVARRVIHSLRREPGADRFDAEDIHDELAQLEGACGQRPSPSRQLALGRSGGVLFGKQLGVVVHIMSAHEPDGMTTGASSWLSTSPCVALWCARRARTRR